MKMWPWLLIGAIVGAFVAIVDDTKAKRGTVPPEPGPRKRKPIDRAKTIRKTTTPPPEPVPPPEPAKPDAKKVEATP